MSDIHTDGLTEEEIESLHRKTVNELKKLAREQGIKSLTGLKKQQLIDKISETAKKQAAAMPGNEASSEGDEEEEIQHTQPYKKRSDRESSDRRGKRSRNDSQDRKSGGGRGKKKKSVHDILPESDAPTLAERLLA